MICPACLEDYRISAGKKYGKFRNEKKRITIKVLPNDYSNYKISGMACPNCGYVAEMTTHPTGNPFFKREEVIDEHWMYNSHQYWMYLEANGLLKGFKEHIKQWKENKIAESQNTN